MSASRVPSLLAYNISSILQFDASTCMYINASSNRYIYSQYTHELLSDILTMWWHQTPDSNIKTACWITCPLASSFIFSEYSYSQIPLSVEWTSLLNAVPRLFSEWWLLQTGLIKTACWITSPLSQLSPSNFSLSIHTPDVQTVYTIQYNAMLISTLISDTDTWHMSCTDVWAQYWSQHPFHCTRPL